MNGESSFPLGIVGHHEGELTVSEKLRSKSVSENQKNQENESRCMVFKVYKNKQKKFDNPKNLDGSKTSLSDVKINKTWGNYK